MRSRKRNASKKMFPIFTLVKRTFRIIDFLTTQGLFERINAIPDLYFTLSVKDIAFYDDPKNGVGALTTRLATDASLVQGVRLKLINNGSQNSRSH